MSNDYTIIRFGDVTIEMMRELVEFIDPRCFPPEHIDLSRDLKLFELDHQMVCLLYSQRKMIGYAQLLPLKESTIAQMKNGNFDCSNILPEHVAAFISGNHYTLYLNGIAILPEHRCIRAYMLLLDETRSFCLRLAEREVVIDDVWAFVTNKKLSNILKKRKFRKINENEDGVPLYSISDGKVLKSHFYIRGGQI